MSDAKKASSDSGKSGKSSSDSSSGSSGSSDSGSGGGKSARESIGGSKEVHYGYFSSVRTPEYRSGWDAIWGKKGNKKKAASSRRKGPIELDLDFDKLPDDLRDALTEHARKKLRRTPNGFRKLQDSGAVEWSLSVRVED